jgi:pyridoxine 5'-phosphate synthase PdxJ
MTSEMNPNIYLIVPNQQSQAITTSGDRMGGQEHGLIESARKLLAKPVDAGAFAERLSSSISNAAVVMERAFTERLGGYAIEDITLSLAVTSEGDIGIATAGVEASVSVTLKRKDETSVSKKK